MKTIGFVDYYISEWHAINYPGWFKEVCEEQGKDFQIKYAWSEREDSPWDNRSADQWCKDFDVERCSTIKELCEKSDYIVILAPSDPDKHLGYAEEVFKNCNGKHVYIDKTFTPDLATALKIYELAEKYGVKFFSSSALRYATEVNEFDNPESLIVTFGGGNMPEYLVHALEIATKIMGVGVTEVKLEKLSKKQYICFAKYADGRAYTLIYAPYFNFTVDAYYKELINNDDCRQKEAKTRSFKNLLSDIIRFFETGEVSFPKEQTLEIMRVREAMIKLMGDEGKWVKI